MVYPKSHGPAGGVADTHVGTFFWRAIGRSKQERLDRGQHEVTPIPNQNRSPPLRLLRMTVRIRQLDKNCLSHFKDEWAIWMAW